MLRRAGPVLLALAALAATAAVGASSARHDIEPGAVDSYSLSSTHARAALPTAAHRTSTWCGTTSTTDRPAGVTGDTIRVYYAMPADGADQSATWAPQISDFLDQMTAWWQREDPSRAPRFDLYAAPCGLQPDLQVIRLAGVSVSSPDPQVVFNQVWDQLQGDPAASYTKFLLFLDDYDTQNLCGLGAHAVGSALGTPSMGLAIDFLQGCNGVDHVSVAAHELLHSVSPDGGLAGAPHACPGNVGHICDSTGDILYPYADSGIPITSLQLDVNHDDYWAGTAPVNLQVQPWFKHTQDQVHLALSIAGSGTVTSDVPGVSCTATCGTDWDRGDTVTLAASAAAGFKFVHWTGACTGGGDCAVTLDASKDVSALFAPSTYGLSVRVVGSGTVSSRPAGLTCKRGTCSKPFPSYQPVFLTAKATKGWRFTGWTGACHGTRTTCSLPMSAPASARAAFAKAK